MTGLIYATIAVLWLVVLAPVVVAVVVLIRKRRLPNAERDDQSISFADRTSHVPKSLTAADYWLPFRRSLRLFPIARLDAETKALAPAAANRRTRLLGTVVMLLGVALLTINTLLVLRGVRRSGNVAMTAVALAGWILAYFGYFMLRFSWIAPRRARTTADRRRFPARLPGHHNGRADRI